MAVAVQNFLPRPLSYMLKHVMQCLGMCRGAFSQLAHANLLETSGSQPTRNTILEECWDCLCNPSVSPMSRDRCSRKQRLRGNAFCN